MSTDHGFPRLAPDASEALAPRPVAASASTALERVMHRFSGLVRQAARARGVIDRDVDEVLQDVRIRLWKTNASEANLDALSASYLRKVALSAAVDFVRRRRRSPTESIHDVTEGEEIPGSLQVPSVDHSEDEELARSFELALAHLPRNRRLTVQLHLEGYSREEIAALTRWSEAKVRNLLYRGLEDLRAQWHATHTGAGS